MPLTVARFLDTSVPAAAVESSVVGEPSPSASSTRTCNVRLSSAASASRLVPPSVPSVNHTPDTPCTSVAVKNRMLPLLASPDGGGEVGADSHRPRAVPSLFQSSVTRVPGSAVKNNVLPTTVSSLGLASTGPGATSVNRTGVNDPASNFHSSRPVVLSTAVKNSVEPLRQIQRVRAGRARIQIGHADGLIGDRIVSPQFSAHRISDGEVKQPVDVRQPRGVRPGDTAKDVGHACGRRGRSAAAPQLASRHTIIDAEVHRAADRRQTGRGRRG